MRVRARVSQRWLVLLAGLCASASAPSAYAQGKPAPPKPVAAPPKPVAAPQSDEGDESDDELYGAEDAPPAAPAKPKPPVLRSARVLSRIEAPYPEGGEGSTVVVLEAVVDADGTLKQLRVVRGDAPFAAASLAAAAGFSYAPATRDDKPISARFLVRIPFRAPPAKPAPKTAAKPAKPKAPPGPRKPMFPSALEVLVQGQAAKNAREPLATRLSAREVEHVPGAFGDAFRAVEVLPGVTPFATGLPYFFVRGAPPSATGYEVDSIRVPFLYHVAAGPSVIHPALIDHVDFFPGAYPAELGRVVGGVVAATTREPASELKAEALLRLIDAGAYVEAPFADGRANAFAAGRYSYTAAALSLVAPDTTLSYWDYQAGGGYALTPRDRLSVLAFGSRDHLGSIEDDESETTLFDTEFHRLALRFDHGRGSAAAPDRASVRLGATIGLDRSTIDTEGDVDDRMLDVRADVAVPLGARVKVRTGAQMTLNNTSYASQFPIGSSDYDEDFAEAFRARSSGTFGAYVDATLRATSSIELIPGLRMDVFGEDGDGRAALDPRGAIRLKLLPAVSSVTAVGLAHQKPSIFVPVPGLSPIGVKDGLQEALQFSEGVTIALPQELSATVTFFHHTYDDLSDLAATCGGAVSECSVLSRADGVSYGLEAMVTRAVTEDLSGLVAYTLSRSTRTVEDETFLSDFDRTHVFHAALSYKIGAGFTAGARITAYSGRPHSILKFDDPDEPDEATVVGRRNALRRDAFYRLDLRVEKRWRIGRTGYISAVLEGMNVTLQKEIIDVDCRATSFFGSGSGLNCSGEEVGPIAIPSLGIAGGF